MPTFDQVISDLIISGQSNGEELGSSFRLALNEFGGNPLYISSASTFGTTSGAGILNRLAAFPVISARGGTLDFVGAIVTVQGGAGSSMRVGLYTAAGLYPQNLLIQSGTINTNAVNGLQGVQVSAVQTASITLAAGTLYWGVVNFGTSGPTVVTATAGAPLFGYQADTVPNPTTTPIWGWQANLAFGALPAVFPQGGTLLTGATAVAVGIRYGSVSRSARAGG